jgi:hypothetical protein
MANLLAGVSKIVVPSNDYIILHWDPFVLENVKLH